MEELGSRACDHVGDGLFSSQPLRLPPSVFPAGVQRPQGALHDLAGLDLPMKKAFKNFFLKAYQFFWSV